MLRRDRADFARLHSEPAPARTIGTRDDSNDAEAGSWSRHQPLQDVSRQRRRAHKNDL
jgi:hypothetical protein